MPGKKNANESYPRNPPAVPAALRLRKSWPHERGPLRVDLLLVNKPSVGLQRRYQVGVCVGTTGGA